MNIVQENFLIKSQELTDSKKFQQLYSEVKKAVSKVRWPKGADEFTIHPEKKGNGVTPIKDACMTSLEEDDWRLEKTMDIATHIRPGAIDAVKESENQEITMAVEWETGNISSSHRAVNKMCIGFLENKLDAGVLILPTRKLYHFLTDRVGSYSELRPYFRLWETFGQHSIDGNLIILGIEHHAKSKDVPKIKKGTDGRALV